MRDSKHFVVAEVGSDLDKHGCLRRRIPHGHKEWAEFVEFLQSTQPRSVRRRDVHGEIIGERGEKSGTQKVIGGRLVDVDDA